MKDSKKMNNKKTKFPNEIVSRKWLSGKIEFWD